MLTPIALPQRLMFRRLLPRIAQTLECRSPDTTMRGIGLQERVSCQTQKRPREPGKQMDNSLIPDASYVPPSPAFFNATLNFITIRRSLASKELSKANPFGQAIFPI
jgi:hypothetical protein